MLDLNKPHTVPLGTRVTHFDGGEGTHGHGTIIEVRKPNGSQPADLEKTAEVLAVQNLSNEGKGIVIAGAVASLYSAVRCPYVVKWDRNEAFFERHPRLKERCPDLCYVDTYEVDSLQNPTTPEKAKGENHGD